MRLLPLLLGPVVAAILLALPAPDGLSPAAWNVVAITAWMVIWWLSEAIPIPATALLPIPLFPALGIAKLGDTTANYGHPLIFLFLGGFIIAAAMQRSGLHRRIALAIISMIGTSPARLVAGFMAATAFLSMWISNTATTVMMYSVAVSIIAIHKERAAGKAPDDPDVRNFSIALLLGIAYAASIGGVGTLIGTPPNALLASILQTTYNIEIDFAQWMMFGIPLVLVMLPVTWLVLTKILYPSTATGGAEAAADALKDHDTTGPMRASEKLVLTVFLAAAIGWVFGDLISDATGIALSDTAVAIAAALLLFAVPYSLQPPTLLLSWDDAKSLPWGILLIFGGGLAIAGAFTSSGLAQSIGTAMEAFSHHGIWVYILLATILIVVLTEVTSNTASAAAFLPIFGAVAIGLGYDPRLLMIPITVGASMAFMMPVATPPNAVVFAHEDMRITDMVRAGIWLNAAAVLVIFAAMYLLAGYVFGIEKI